MTYRLTLPLYVGGTVRTLKDGRKTKPTKKHWLNLNNYRNWHYQTANTTKKLFKAAVTPQIMSLPDLTALWGQVRFGYILFPPDKRKRDLTNSVSIIDKYFVDALVELGKLEDDNLTYVPEIGCRIGKIDRVNPRMEVVITRQYPIITI